ncbi:hypothetical protein [Salinibacter ruber]|uniref:hypothetical protein n=1 Tax=Salinibacter ruber TaxID=146919 RepID=UPI002169A356|nr:hypothetical protein [Salinibacter ruber]MCS4142412.1 hypothetical protein [Salinibacter ruber]
MGFLVGGARCATTTTAYTLAEHPDIYLPDVKEPTFFGNTYDYGCPSFKEYKNLYNKTDSNVLLDCSTAYLHIDNVPREISKKITNPYIIIHLRDPIERAKSQYRLQVRNKNENLSFKGAIDKEEERKNKGSSQTYHYTTKSFYYKEVQGFLSEFENVRIVLFENFVDEPMKVIRDHAKFLSADPQMLPGDTVDSNAGNEPLVPIINDLLVKEFPFRKNIAELFPWSFRRWLVMRIRSLNLSDKKKKLDIDSDISKNLVDMYSEDVKKLNNIIEQPLEEIWPRYFN